MSRNQDIVQELRGARPSTATQSDALVDFLRAGPPDGARYETQRSAKGMGTTHGWANQAEQGQIRRSRLMFPCIACCSNHPYSSYSTSAVPLGTTVYGTPPCGIIGVHRPREILRVERDWSGGDVCQ